MLNAWSRLITAIIAIFALSAGQAFAQAGTPTGATLMAIVVDASGKPVPEAAGSLQGPTSRNAASDASGKLLFTDLQPGLYSLTISRSGFQSVTNPDVVVAATQSITINATLLASSFTSLGVIGRVTTSTGRAPFNTTAASVALITANDITTQGQTQVTQALNQTPGISTQAVYEQTPNPGNQFGIPTLRGALPYETSILIDGHPVAIGNTGTYNLSYLTPYVLQNIEVVKGPGASVPTINNAIGGSINFRTLDPTAQPKQSVDYGLDSELGSFISLKATGTAGRFGYALDYYSLGSPGPYHNMSAPVAPFFGGSINGVPIASSFNEFPGSPNVAASSYNASSLAGCCGTINSDYQVRNELGKLRYNIGNSTTVTMSYLGGQVYEDAVGGQFYDYPTVFTPGPAFTGGGPYAIGGPAVCCEQAGYYPNPVYQNDNLFQGEVSTAIGNVTLLGRYYSGSNNVFTYAGTPSGANLNLNLWGSAYLGPGNGTLTYFNGQPALYTSTVYYGSESWDKFGGYSFEAQAPAGPNTYTMSYDSLNTKSVATQPYNLSEYSIPPGSGQQQQTFRLSGQFALAPTLKLTLSDYEIIYTDHTTADSGLTFNDYTHSFNGARLGATWQPQSGLSIRLGAGSSIAPPYLSLVSSVTNPPSPNSNGNPTYFTQTANAPDLKPETGFGYDLGADKRLDPNTVVSADVYLTHLQNQFLVQQIQNGTYTGTTSVGVPYTLPLYLSTASNLGNAIYEGVELSVKRVPLSGFGYVAQAALQRGYTYNLPAGFYNTASGPNTTNLGVIPYANYCGSGSGYNGLAFSCIPYAQGYGELNYTTKTMFFRAGLTYFGNNNSYNVPAFTILSASVRAQITPRLSAVLSGDNLAGTNANGWLNTLNGIAVPLVNGQVGMTESHQYGPEIVRLTLTYSTGSR